MGLASDLRSQIRGEVRDDAVSKAVYSVDASIYEIEPIAIVLPLDKEDLATAVEIARAYQVPIVPRGAATGIAGGCIGSGLILDTSKYFTHIREINYQAEYAICEPGVIQSQLNAALAAADYRLGPDTSTGNRATLGGMLGNNAAGSRSLRYGKMSDHIQEVELLLYTGEFIRFKSLNHSELKQKLSLNSREGEIYREIMRIKSEYAEDIVEHFPKLLRRVSGYNLNELLVPGDLNLAKLIAGSEGSLGVITELRVKICRRPKPSGLCLIQCHSLHDAFSLVTDILEWHPLSLEMVDSKIINAGRSIPLTVQRTAWVEGDPKAVLIVEFDAENLTDQLEKFAAAMRKNGLGYSIKTMTAPNEMADVWAVRESGVGLLLSKRGYNRAIAFIEDIAVPPNVLAPFMDEFLQLLKGHGKEAGVYGHAGAGCIHIRPYVNLRDPAELKTMHALMEATSDLLLRYQGCLSGEHGDGIVRSWLNEKMFGKRVYQAFIDLKKAFDPTLHMNPGKIVAMQGLEENLRMSPETHPREIQTAYDFSREGGFALAVDMCNGNGSCRKREGLMCPSFQAFGDEFHSTRARAQSFRAIVNGKLPLEAFTSHELYHVLEYCLECKGCKTECPSQVDMAKMKAEFLYHYQKKWGASLRSKLFANLATINKLSAPLSSLFNAFNNSWVGKKLLRSLGIATQRTLPPLAANRFSKDLPLPPSNPTVVLFLDTYTEFHHPEIGQSALKILKAIGCEVIVPPWTCCGRPLISKGFLDQAKQYAQKVINLLLPYARKGLPILGLEPSCIFTIKDEYPDLLPGKDADLLAAQCMPIEGFLAQQVLPINTIAAPIHFHTHCHQKALQGSANIKAVLKSAPNTTEINSGCCGLAGSFGYEEEHYAMSMQIGENKLFPAVKKAGPEAIIIANGMSCRSQIQHGTGRKAIHLVELLAKHLVNNGPAGQNDENDKKDQKE
ncbi:MAG: FAD-linked oxidase C-terminal domain-containing protein [Chlamydiales bacterium]|nr:FAD-linked oxidase C-terminal domain-containing protein [Chlamydiales bacterium]